jgi:hypothetical protein
MNIRDDPVSQRKMEYAEDTEVTQLETESDHEQLISISVRFNLAFGERDKKHTMIDLRAISINWFKNQLCPSIRFSRLWAL